MNYEIRLGLQRILLPGDGNMGFFEENHGWNAQVEVRHEEENIAYKRSIIGVERNAVISHFVMEKHRLRSIICGPVRTDNQIDTIIKEFVGNAYKMH